MNDIIEIKGVSKSFEKRVILDRVDLAIHKGEIVSFVGDNGAGKSTIIKMIAGLIYQDTGKIQVFGISNQDNKIRNICEFVFESGLGFYGYLTAYENIRYFLGLNKIKFKNIKTELDELCEKFDFKQHLDKKVDALSQGNRQKMSLIVSLIVSPEVLMLDEPTNGLDKNSIDVLSDILISKNKNQNMTILMTSHDTHFLEKLNAKTILVKEGKISRENSFKE